MTPPTEDTDREREGEPENAADLLSMERRRLLQATGAGLGGLSLVGFGGDVATAASDCADGPFERTYSGATVNTGEIRADQARSGTPDDVSAATPKGAATTRSGRQPPRKAAQESNVGEEGPLSVHAEYDGVGAAETRGGVPSDSQVAAGSGHVVHALNQQVAFFDKRAGVRQHMFDLERLWEPVIPEPEGGFAYGYPFVFDPRARYDRAADRFVLCAVQYEPGITTDGELVDREEMEEGAEPGEEGGSGDTAAETQLRRPPRGWWMIAVSATSNPNGNWHVYRVPPLDNEGLVDYPALGLDRDAVYLTQNFFGDNFEVTMATLDKAALYAGEDVTAHHFTKMNNPDADAPFTFTAQPALQPFSGGSSGRFYLVNSGFDSSALTLWELTDPVSDPSLTCHTVEVGPYSYPPAARQPGTDALVDTLGTRLMNADYDDGSLWTAHSVLYDWNGDGTPVAAVRWYEIDVETKTLVQSGVYGAPGTSYFIPTVGADDGRTVLAHNVSGPETYPRMDVAGRTADFPRGRLEDSVVVQEGESSYDYGEGSTVMRWGDYNGVSVDPLSGRFWTVAQYSPDVEVPPSAERRDPYATRIAEVDFDGE
ncbi:MULTISPECIES: hypothetical protein [Halorussus]|uniref:hypothetical protein n=1 Tax=Halorussus TaxID=1070314 RepID=UPI0020A07257|nr:hypothetical protein [Halorussus vallis]USZ75929.1 hypothetical protein NGM07_01080 [Halorussus vallis]